MPWEDCTGPWWMNAGANGASGYGCCGSKMRLGRGNAARQAFMAARYGPFRQPAPAEEKSYLEDVARNLEEELASVRERIENLRSGV